MAINNEKFGDGARRRYSDRVGEDTIDGKGPAQRNPVTGTLRFAATVPQVTGLTLEQSPGAIEASWDAVKINNLKRYEIHVSSNSAFADATIRYATETQFTYEEGVASTTYYFRVRAVNIGNKVGAWSSPAQSAVPGAITSSDIADGSVTEAKLAADSVTSAKIATGAVGNSEIASGAVDTDELAVEAVHVEDLTFTSTTVVNSGTTELQWATENITSEGNEIKIEFGMCYLFNGGTTDGTWTVRVRTGTGGGGTILYSQPFTSDSGAVGWHPFYSKIIHTPGAGSATYEATIQRSSGNRDITVQNRVIHLNEIKR